MAPGSGLIPPETGKRRQPRLGTAPRKTKTVLIRQLTDSPAGGGAFPSEIPADCKRSTREAFAVRQVLKRRWSARAGLCLPAVSGDG